MFYSAISCSGAGVPSALQLLAQERCHRYSGRKLPSFAWEEGINNFFFLSFRSVLNNSLSLSSLFFFCKTTELYIVHYFQCQVFYESKNYFPVFSSDSPICILRNYLLYLFILFQNIVYIGYFKKYYYYLIFWLILDKLQREMPASTKFLPSHSSIVWLL